MGTQLNLHPITSLGPVVYQQEVGVVVIEAGEAALALDVHRIMGWKTSLQKWRWGERGYLSHESHLSSHLNAIIVCKWVYRIPLDAQDHPYCE